MRFSLIRMTALIVGLALSGCSMGDREAELSAAAPQVLQSTYPTSKSDLEAHNLPPFPPARAASGVVETLRLGRESFDEMGGTINGDDLEFAPAAGELAWGIWDFTPGDFTPQSIELAMDIAPGAAAYYALADYSTLSWVTSGPITTGQSIPVDPLRHLSGSGDIYLAVLVFDGNATAINQLTLSAEGNLQPLADLTADVVLGNPPLTVNLNASASADNDGSITTYEWDFDGDGLFSETDNGEDLAAESATAMFTYTAIGQYSPAVRVTDNEDAQNTASILIDVVEPNDPPVADLQANNTAINPLGAVIFDAGASFDPDGTIEGIEWDVDGDGNFGEPGPEASRENETTAVVTYPFSGVFYAQVRVTDDDGAQDTDTLAITVFGWAFVPVDMPGDVGRFASLAVIDGNPAISYYDATLGDLKYARALNGVGANPADWGNRTLDELDDVGSHTSLAEVAGQPAISYIDNSNSSLCYARSTGLPGPGGTAWALVDIDVGNGAGWYSSLVVVNGNPAISCYNGSTGGLHYARASSLDGTDAGDWALTELVAGDLGLFSNLLVVAATPAVCYQDQGLGDLKYIRSSTASGGAAIDWTPVTVSSATDTGYYCSMSLVDGNPAIAYSDNTTGSLIYARSATADGMDMADWTETLVDAGPATHCSLTVAGGLPVILYRNGPGGDLCLAESSSAIGETPSDWTLSTLDQDFQPEYCSATEVNGQLAVAYFEDLFDDLVYAIRLAP